MQEHSDGPHLLGNKSHCLVPWVDDGMLMVQEHHIWLNLAEVKQVGKVGQAGFFGDAVKNFAQ